MKKLLVVVVLCLIFGGNAFAKEIILSQCYNSKIAYADGDPVDQETINQLITKEFDKSKWIEVKFEFDLQKNIFRKVMISTDEALETARKKNPDKKYKNESSWVFSIYNVYARKNWFSLAFRTDEDGQNSVFRTYLFRIVPSVTYNFKF